MSRLKSEQHSFFLGVDVNLPIRASTVSEAQEQVRRKWRAQSREEFMRAFETAQRDYIRQWIANNSRNRLEGMARLRAGRSVPKGFLTKVDVVANLDKGESNRRCADDSSLPKASVLWNQFLDSIFDELLAEYQTSQQSSTPSGLMSDLTMGSPMSTASPMSTDSPMSIYSPTGEEKLTDDDQLVMALEAIREQESQENYAVSTVRLGSILRKDLDRELHTKFFTKINDLVPNISDFMIDYQTVVFLSMSLFRSHAIVPVADKFIFQANQGFQTKSIFPPNFVMQNQIQYSANPLPSITDPKFDLQVKHLFTDSRFLMIFSEHYGAIGMTTKSRINYPTIASMADITKSLVKDNSIYNKGSLARPCYSSAVNAYITNFSTMWGKKKILNGLLDKLLLVLLRVHLAPNREKKRQDYLNSLKNKQVKKKKESSISYSMRRYSIRDIKYKLKQCEKRTKGGDDKWSKRATKLRKKLEFLQSSVSKPSISQSSRKRPLQASTSQRPRKTLAIQVPKSKMPARLPLVVNSPATIIENRVTEEAQQFDYPIDEDYESDDQMSTVEEQLVSNEEDKDTSRRRVLDLKGFLKSMIFREEAVTEQVMKNQRSDLSEAEEKVCLLIVKSLKPYIPSKQKYGYVAYQLPFVILANNLLSCAGYEKFTRRICPMPSTGINAFRMDTTSLYTTFCQHGEDRLRFFKYNNSLFQSTVGILNHKDAIWNSFFDISKIQTACQRSKLRFAHNITILPGAKYVRILGVKQNIPKQTTAALNKQSLQQRSLPQSTWQKVLTQACKDKKTLKNEIDVLQKEINDLTKELQNCNKVMNDAQFETKIKVAKSYWKDPFGESTAQTRPFAPSTSQSEPSSTEITQARPITTEQVDPGTPVAVSEAAVNPVACLEFIGNCTIQSLVQLIGCIVQTGRSPIGYNNNQNRPTETDASAENTPQADSTQLETPVQSSTTPDTMDTVHDKIFTIINALKGERYKAHRDLQDCRKKLSSSKFEQYIRRRALTLPQKDLAIKNTTTTTRIEKKDPNEAGTIMKAEDAGLIPDDGTISKDFMFSGTDYGIVKMSESVPVTIEKYRYHLALYNRFSSLASLTEETEPEFEALPNVITVTAQDVDFGSRTFHYRGKLARLKKNNQGVLEAEKNLSERSLSKANYQDEIWNAYRCIQENKGALRGFYQSSRMNTLSMRREKFGKKAKDRICSRERQFLNPLSNKKQKGVDDPKGKRKQSQQVSKQLIMMIGDKGKGVGSTIKGHLRYGGNWKQDNHARYTPVCITNEDYTSQTCVYCFEKLHHPKQSVVNQGKTIKKIIKGTFICYNPRCPSVRNGCGTSGRDKLSALAIAISGITVLLFGEMLPPFTNNISHFNTDLNNKLVSFCIGSEPQAESHKPL